MSPHLCLEKKKTVVQSLHTLTSSVPELEEDEKYWHVDTGYRVARNRKWGQIEQGMRSIRRGNLDFQHEFSIFAFLFRGSRLLKTGLLDWIGRAPPSWFIGTSELRHRFFGWHEEFLFRVCKYYYIDEAYSRGEAFRVYVILHISIILKTCERRTKMTNNNNCTRLPNWQSQICIGVANNMDCQHNF